MKHKFKTFEELNTYLRYNVPPEDRKPHTGNWSLFYGTICLLENKPYSACKEQEKQFRMKGIEYPDKSKFKIKPHK